MEIGRHMRNGRNYTGGGDGTIRYVKDPNDPNFDWIQVQDEDGNWINVQRAYTQRYELYVDKNNGGEFEAYAGTIISGGPTLKAPTLTLADTLTVSLTGSGGSVFYHGCAITKAIDLSRFKTLSFYHTSSANEGSSSTYVHFFITQAKAGLMTAVVSLELVNAYTGANKSGTVSIDISDLNGDYYIGFVTGVWAGANAKTTISNMYME